MSGSKHRYRLTCGSSGKPSKALLSPITLPHILERLGQRLRLHRTIRVPGVASKNELVVIALLSKNFAIRSFAKTQS